MDPNRIVFKLIPGIQTYEWGKLGRESRVVNLLTASQTPDFKLDEEARYAELWMGTYPKLPAKIRDESKELLSEYLAQHKELMGSDIIKKFKSGNGDLPFLFKVLFMGKSLSIQVHPKKSTAERLHEDSPADYPDDNHKPEMALALTPFSGLCGFKPFSQITKHLKNTSELKELVSSMVDRSFSITSSPDSSERDEKTALQDLVASLLSADDQEVKEKIKTLIGRYQRKEFHEGEDEDLAQLVLTLNDQFPGDVGIFLAYLMNYVHLEPGEAVYIPVGTPHAYTSGDCIECMASSDNVVHAALTSEKRDLPNFMTGVIYDAIPSDHMFIPSKPFRAPSSHSTLYDPPIEELAVVQAKVPSNDREEHPPIHGPSIAIVLGGQGKVLWEEQNDMEVSVGDVFFIGAEVGITFVNVTRELLFVVRAFVEA